MLSAAKTKSMQWRGAITAAWVGMIGCTLYIMPDTLSLLTHDFPSLDSIMGFVIVVLAANLFALPFLAIGGWILGWLVERNEWYSADRVRAVIAGAMIALLTITVIVEIIGFVLLYFDSPGITNWDDVGSIMLRLVIVFPDHLRIFWPALFIAAICGGITGWRLTKFSPQE